MVPIYSVPISRSRTVCVYEGICVHHPNLLAIRHHGRQDSHFRLAGCPPYLETTSDLQSFYEIFLD